MTATKDTVGGPDPGGTIRVLAVATPAAGEGGTEWADGRLRVDTAGTAAEALAAVRADEVDCVVAGYDLPDGDGIGLLRTVREEDAHLPFVLYTDGGSEAVASEAITAGVTDYVTPAEDGGPALADRIREAVAQYRSRRDLETSRERLSLLVEQSPLGIIEWDEDFEVVALNDTAEEILGCREDGLLGTSWERLIAEDEREEVRRQAARLEDGGEFRNVAETVRADGSTIHCEWYNRTVTDADGEVVTVLSQFRDVTDRRERERDLERYETVANTAGDMVYILDTDGRFQFVNDTAEELTGYDREDLLGAHTGLIMDAEEDVAAGRELIRNLLRDADPGERASRTSDAFSWTLRTADGGTAPCESHITLLFENGEWVGTVGVVRDVSERLERERRLERQNERLDRFASVVSHDLRNPLNVAASRIELARAERDGRSDDGEGDSGSESEDGGGGSGEHLAAAADALDRGQALIDDLLRLAREGESARDTEPVALADAATEAWRNVSTDGAALIVEADATVRADPPRLRRLLENLVRNAIEHAAASERPAAGDGSDGVEVVVGDSEEGFYVADDGPGIPAADRDEVFESGYSTAEDGSGFGLAIVREIADAHGWTVEVGESETGGARFEVGGVGTV